MLILLNIKLSSVYFTLHPTTAQFISQNYTPNQHNRNIKRGTVCAATNTY